MNRDRLRRFERLRTFMLALIFACSGVAGLASIAQPQPAPTPSPAPTPATPAVPPATAPPLPPSSASPTSAPTSPPTTLASPAPTVTPASFTFPAGTLNATLAPATPSPAPTPANPYEALLVRRNGDTDGVGLIVGKFEGEHMTVTQAGTLLGTPLGSDTLFEIGSVTKTFTATLLAIMVLDGEVKLDDPVQKYLPANVHVPTYHGKAITLLSLATQRSGLPRFPANFDPSSVDPYAKYSMDNLYAFLNGYTLTRAPGDTFEYSNLGIALLGNALAYRAHLSYESLLQKKLLQPLGMGSTTTLRTPSVIARLAIGHDVDGNTAGYVNFRAFAPSAAIVSSMSDMLKFLQCNLGRGPLAKACLFAQQPRGKFPAHLIGLVWWVDAGSGVIEHGGDTDGYHAGIAIAPDRSSGAVALTNGGSGATDVAINAVDATQPLALPPDYLKLDPKSLAEYAGAYVGIGAFDGVRYVIDVHGDALSASLGPEPAAAIFPTEKDVFEYHVVAATVRFVRAPDGSIAGLHFYQDGRKAAFVKAGADPQVVAIPSPTAQPPPLPLEPADLMEYSGTYHTILGVDLFVLAHDGVLYAQLTGQPAYQILQAAKDHFFYKQVDAEIDFERDATGKISSLTLHQNGRDVRAPRAQ